MAVSFPLTLAQFSARLRVTGLSLHCPTPKSQSRTAGGEIIQARLGASLWQGECQLSFARQMTTSGVRSLVDLLLDPAASFLFSPGDYYGPALDPGGTLLGSANVTVSGVAANNRDITLAGLPNGYKLSGDDLLSFTYGTNPVRYAFHRVVFTTGGASSGRVTAEVWPRVRPGWVAGAAVELKKPVFKAVMEDRDAGSSARVFHSGMSFNYIQTFR